MTDFSRAYKYNAEGFYQEEVKCQIDPLSSSVYGRTVYLLPGDSTWTEPLPEKEGFKVKWNGESWEYWKEPEPEPYVPTPEEEKQAETMELKAQLSETDYKIIKCSECSLAGLDLPYDVAELHAERQAIRDKINELEE